MGGGAAGSGLPSSPDLANLKTFLTATPQLLGANPSAVSHPRKQCFDFPAAVARPALGGKSQFEAHAVVVQLDSSLAAAARLSLHPQYNLFNWALASCIMVSSRPSTLGKPCLEVQV